MDFERNSILKLKPGLGLTGMKKSEWIYDMMNGALIGDALMLPKEDIIVTSEFQEGMYCYKQYEKVFHAKIRIEERLFSDEDEDTESIINNMNDITRYLSMKLYDYGKAGSKKIPIACEYKEDSYCYKRYQEVLQAKQNLEFRLGVRSDDDLENMAEGMLNIMKHFACRIYAYGEAASKRDKSV